jgi:hypothetical protein
MILKRFIGLGLVLFLVIFVSGCGNPATSAIKYGAKIVGKVVDEAEVAEYEEKLVGQPPTTADAEFGERVDVFRDTKGRRYFITYRVKLDPLDVNRIVVEVSGEKIVAVSKVEKGGSKIDIPRKLILEDKIKGKPPAECQRELEMGPPLLAVKRDSDGALIQLYNAGIVKEIDKQHYCLVRYDTEGLCRELAFLETAASTEGGI